MTVKQLHRILHDIPEDTDIVLGDCEGSGDCWRLGSVEPGAIFEPGENDDGSGTVYCASMPRSLGMTEEEWAVMQAHPRVLVLWPVL